MPVLALVLGLAVALGVRVSSLQAFWFAEGILLLGTVAASHLRTVSMLGWHACLIGSKCDISYYFFSLPFLLLSIPGEDAYSPRDAAQVRKVAA